MMGDLLIDKNDNWDEYLLNVFWKRFYSVLPTIMLDYDNICNEFPLNL